MASYNRVILVGNLTRDVDLKYTGGGMAVTELGLAVNDRRKNQQGEWVEETTFVDVTMFGRTAEIASEYLSKGSPVLVEGRLRYETWEKEGQKRSKLSVVADKMQMLGSRGEGAPRGEGGGGGGGAQRRPGPTRNAPAGNSRPQQQDDFASGGASYDDDIPF